MAKIHDLFIIELAEVIKGYGNDPDDKDPFRLSEFYRFYELPNIAVSRENFEKMRPVEQDQRWIPCSDRLPKAENYMPKRVIVTTSWKKVYVANYCVDHWEICDIDYKLSSVVAWMPLPEPYKEEN